jgi:Rieske Fe-S protein
VDGAGRRLRASALEPHAPYCFFYPYVSTPCLLLDLGTAVAPAEPVAGDRRLGGVGAPKAIVAYTAICPHEWSHPDPAFSPIRYVAPGEPAVLTGGRDRLIVCCSHGSVFDPAVGGRVEQSPARTPLASVVLEWDATSDGLAAVGVSGPTSFERFFASFERDQRLVTEPARVIPLATYSKVVGRC